MFNDPTCSIRMPPPGALSIADAVTEAMQSPIRDDKLLRLRRAERYGNAGVGHLVRQANA
ncbi:hypothetical protein [Paraburkholderia antibiotica]|uniref:Uncharacterized protein n=1 Tax=Paraburkholderia antibiotica TaxID=2728839 RepID=A0A7X9X6B2_9BURK|nr:hypothetical protein [Paraburkholderia antibiotica]NML32309.1 hypothetical protein [Paraburkholderia antibiotica]